MRAVNAVNYCSPILHSSGNLSSRIPLKIACLKPFFVDGIYSTVHTTGSIHIAFSYPFGILLNGQFDIIIFCCFNFLKPVSQKSY